MLLAFHRASTGTKDLFTSKKNEQQIQTIGTYAELIERHKPSYNSVIEIIFFFIIKNS